VTGHHAVCCSGNGQLGGRWVGRTQASGAPRAGADGWSWEYDEQIWPAFANRLSDAVATDIRRHMSTKLVGNGRDGDVDPSHGRIHRPSSSKTLHHNVGELGRKSRTSALRRKENTGSVEETFILIGPSSQMPTPCAIRSRPDRVRGNCRR